MKKNYNFTCKGSLCVLLFLIGFTSFSQTTTVFSDNFSSYTDQFYTITPGVIGNPVSNPKWQMARSGADYAAAIATRGLYLTNSGSSASNNNGWVLASVLSSQLSLPYSNTLSNNPGIVSWTFNMRQSRSNPSGFSSTGYGVAFILAGTNGSTNVTGTGYAVVLGNSFSTDYIRLVRYNSGIRNSTTLIQSNTSGLTDFGANYTSVKVTYNPAGNVWQLFLRNDGSSAAANPKVGNLTSQGTTSNSTYVGTSLPLLGGYLNGGTNEGFVAYYNYINVDVNVPFISSISPNSKIAGTGAFTLTVNGENFINGTSKVFWNGALRTTTFISSTQLTAAITAADISSAGTAQVTVVNGTTVSNAEVFTIDSPGVPTLTPSTGIVNLATTVTGTASTSSSYTLTGVNLGSNPILTAPTHFQISTDGTNFFDSLNLARYGFNLNPQPTTIFVRTKSTAPAGIYSVNITNAVTSGVTKLVTIKAKVLALQPTLQSTGLTFTNVSSTSFKINWTNGNGERRLVLIKSSSAVNSLPVDGTFYASNTVFGAGAEIGTGNFVIYSGVDNTTTVTGLSAATTYHISIVEYNGSVSDTENYLTTGNLLGSQLTRNAPAGWQIYTVNTVNTIDFDNTVDGVNTDAYQGTGLSPDGGSGELNSKAFAITGFSDGNIAFSGTSVEDTDYDSGVSGGSVSEGGFYSFETSPDNFSLGVQPTTADFTPGTLTLRVQNQTNVAMTSLNIGYKIYIRNDQAASSSFNFSHSVNNSTYTSIAAIDVVSPAAADAVPEWKSYYRATTISGFSVAPGNYYYLRWTGGDSGSVIYDEFALDDIVLVTNPTTTFVPFSGTAQSFVLNGNAELSGNLQVENDLTFNGGKLSIGANTLSLKGSVTNTTPGGIKGSLTSNFIVDAAINTTLSFDQTSLGTTNAFNNFTIASTGINTTSIANPIVVNGGLSVNENQTLDLGVNALSGGLTTAVINGTLLTQNTTALPLPSGKVWTGTGTVNYNSVTTAQTVVAGTYNGLTVTPTTGATAGGNLIVNGILNLPTANPTAIKGSLSLGANTLTMGGNATNTGIGDVTGDVLRTSIVPNVLYTFGHKDTSILFPNVGTLPTSMGLRIDIGTAPAWKPDGVKRIYDFKQTGGSGTKAVIKGHYLDSELNGNNESKLVDYVNRTVAPIGTFEQGRSNYNTTENWVELTNADVAQAFYSNFDIVKLGFAETAVAFATWTGATSDSWITNTNWSPQTVPSLTTTVVIPNATTTNNDPLIVSGSEVLKITIEAGGIVNAPTNSQFTVYGGAGAWVNNGTFNPGAGTSTVTFLNLDATIAGSTTFNNLIIASGAGLRPLTGNVLSIAGTFTKTGTFTPAAIDNTVIFTGTNQTIPALTVGVQGYNNLIINGTGAVFPTSLRITGDLTLNNPIDFSGKTIEMTGVTPQIIGGTAANFNNLTVNNTNGGVSLSSATSVTGTLTLTSGQLKLGTNNLTLGLNAVSGTFDSSKMIVTDGTGEVRRAFTTTGSYLFPVGENTTHAYCPITVNVTAGSFASAYVGASVKSGKHPNNYSLQNYLNRYWVVNQSGITGALATISASYLPSDLSSAENNIVAAQLNGNFNQINNPWIKFSNLNSNTLTVGNATLTSGQTSTFTGISAENFTTTITGFGSFCKDAVVTLTAENTGGDGPYSYLWSNGLGTASTATPPTSAFGTVNYSVTVRDANGIVDTDTADVTVLQPSAGGFTNTNQTICKGSFPNSILLTGQTGDILYWQKSEDPSFLTGTTNISDITNILTAEDAGRVYATTYFRAVISNGNCAVVFSTSTQVSILSTTWDGVSWDNGVPNGTMNVIIAGAYTASSDIEACSVTVENDVDFTVPSGLTLTVNGAVITTDGTLILEDDASLLQTDDSVENVGTNFTVNREAEPMYRLDFTYWSSPVENQSLFNLSPSTLANKYFGWDAFNESWIVYNSGNKIMMPGEGYVVRAPQSFSINPAFLAVYNGVFEGKPNNGIYTVPVIGTPSVAQNNAFNLLGNPYPSALYADAFLDANSDVLEGTLYFWTHNTPFNGSFTYTSTDYATYNLLGGTSTAEAAPSDSDPSNNTPLGLIASGQGFFAGVSVDGNVIMDNSMRDGGANNQFFKSAANSTNEKHRLWLNITNTNGGFKQLLVGYATNATSEYDKGWDGELFSSNSLTFYSFVGDKKLSIQSLPLPFVDSNVVPLGYKTNFAGVHKISIDNLDGLFENQNVYIQDNLLDIVHNIKLTDYEFSTTAGTFDNRFEIAYLDSTLGTGDFTLKNKLYVYKENESIVIKSPSVEMKSIKIIDMQGRVLHAISNVNDFQSVIDLNVAQQVLLISITTKDNGTITRKLLY